jgi:hypothetical protein
MAGENSCEFSARVFNGQSRPIGLGFRSGRAVRRDADGVLRPISDGRSDRPKDEAALSESLRLDDIGERDFLDRYGFRDL